MPTKSELRPARKVEEIDIKTFIKDYVYRIDLDADYQREKVWSRENQEQLLDSIIKNIDIPKLYLARIAGNKTFDYECIDGKQRMGTLLSFYKPDPKTADPLTVRVAGEKYTYKRLERELPQLARKFDDFQLSFVIYSGVDDDEFLREIFRRLQLGKRLNSGELLKTYAGTMRDFIYKELGNEAHFLRHTSLSDRRFSRQFTLAQICINSFSRRETGAFVRARYDDLEDFFKEKADLSPKDENLKRIRQILRLMDKDFGEGARIISSRAVAVSAYLFVEGLYLQDNANLIRHFATFYIKLLSEIRENLILLRKLSEPSNKAILEGFQKHISQASVEPFAIRGRDLFLRKAFEYYLDPKTKGKIISRA
jgi:hypothetical protein